ncbi:hypothetical protein COBT_003377 [Conglomerata obtusa]
MYKEIKNDLKSARPDKGLQKYFDHEFKKLTDIYTIGIDILEETYAFSYDYDIVFKTRNDELKKKYVNRNLHIIEVVCQMIYNKYNTEYLNKNLHLIEIAKEIKNILTICLYQMQ